MAKNKFLLPLLLLITLALATQEEYKDGYIYMDIKNDKTGYNLVEVNIGTPPQSINLALQTQYSSLGMSMATVTGVRPWGKGYDNSSTSEKHLEYVQESFDCNVYGRKYTFEVNEEFTDIIQLLPHTTIIPTAYAMYMMPPPVHTAFSGFFSPFNENFIDMLKDDGIISKNLTNSSGGLIGGLNLNSTPEVNQTANKKVRFIFGDYESEMIPDIDRQWIKNYSTDDNTIPISKYVIGSKYFDAEDYKDDDDDDDNVNDDDDDDDNLHVKIDVLCKYMCADTKILEKDIIPHISNRDWINCSYDDTTGYYLCKANKTMNLTKGAEDFNEIGFKINPPDDKEGNEKGNKRWIRLRPTDYLLQEGPHKVRVLIEGNSEIGKNVWRLGGSFLKKVYTIFCEHQISFWREWNGGEDDQNSSVDSGTVGVFFGVSIPLIGLIIVGGAFFLFRTYIKEKNKKERLLNIEPEHNFEDEPLDD